MEETKRVSYDYSMLSTFLRCRRRYHFRYVRNLATKSRQTAAEFGHAIHSALDSWHTHRDLDRATQVFRNEFVPDETDNKRTISVGVKMLQLYAEKYAHEGFMVLKSEMPFKVPIPGTNVDFIGRIDKIVDWDGAIYILDHKTTSRLGHQFFYMIKPNMQFDGYIWSARQLGFPKCSGVVLDALLVAKGLTTPAQLAKLTPLARDISTRTEEELGNFLKDIKSTIRDIEACHLTNEWYPNTGACCDFVECPYRKVCKEEPIMQERIIQMEYKEEAWTPFEEGVQIVTPTQQAK